MLLMSAFVLGGKMLKNIQSKIVLIFFILGLIIIMGLGVYFITEIEEVSIAVSSNSIQTEEQILRIVKLRNKSNEDSNNSSISYIWSYMYTSWNVYI